VFGNPFPIESVGSGHAHGKVIVLKRTGASWAGALTSYVLEASDKRDGDYFGSDVAISSGRILVGADEREIWDTSSDIEAIVQKGKAYIFLFDGTNWIEEQILVPNSAALQDRFHFGAFVALDGDKALVGNNAQMQGDCETPPVYGFHRNAGGNWDVTVIIPADYIGEHACSFGRGVSLNGNFALIEGQGNTYLLENWEVKQNLYPYDHDGYTDHHKHGNNLVLGSDVAFVGVDRGVSYVVEEGSVHVYDNFSERSVGPEDLTYRWSSGSISSVQIDYVVGHGQFIQEELLQANCIDPISDISFSSQEGSYAKNLTHDYHYFYYIFNDASNVTSEHSTIFDSNTWEINVCHATSLVGSSTVIEKQQVLKFDIELEPSGVVGGSFGDPHIVTFDQLKYDCQAAGIFTTLKSLQDATFEIQERFTKVVSGSCSQASVSTGVVFKDGDKPLVQVSTPGYGEASLHEVNGCPIDIFVDGVESTVDAINVGSNVLVKFPRSDGDAHIKIIHTDTHVNVKVKVDYSSTFGCFLMVQVYLPDSFRDGETLLGLLGTPNGDMTDDWVSVSPEGVVSVIETPSTEKARLFSTAYDYCVTNWCQDSSNSLFTLRESEEFVDINKCDEPYNGDIEESVNNLIGDPILNQDLYDSCTYFDYTDNSKPVLELSCIVDGLCGDIHDAYSARNDLSEIKSKREQLLIYQSQYEHPPVYPMETSTWDIRAQVTAINPDSSPDYGFGWSVAMSGDTFIAGSYNSAEYIWETDSYGPGQGSARVFKYSGPESEELWEQQGEALVVNDPDDSDAAYVGYRVAIDGNTALISATRGVGGVARLFIFELTENGWDQTAMLHIDNDYLDDERIPRVALEGGTALYGRGHGGHGKVFVYTKYGSDWSNPQVQELTASDGAVGDYFGADVAISGNIILVGASQRDMPESLVNVDGFRRGKAYVFVKNEVGTWTQEDVLYHPWASDRLQFGSVVALDGNTAMIGHDSNWGHVTVFKRNFGDWKLQENIYPLSDNWDHWSFGKSIDINGDMALVGGDSGEVTLLGRSRFGLWNILDVFHSIGWHYSSRLGRNVALGSDVALVGTDSGLIQEGSVQVFDTFSPEYIGPETIKFAYNGTYYPHYPNLDRLVLISGFYVGYGHEAQFEVYEKDCLTSITDIPYNSSLYDFRASFSETGMGFELFFDVDKIEGSAIYNSESWEIEVCVVVNLKESPEVNLKQLVSMFHAGSGTPPGPENISFSGSWTNGNGITTNYFIGRDRENNAVLLQKDCETPISDTNVTGHNYTYPMNSTYDYYSFRYDLDPTTIRESSIFNATSSTIEVCHEVRLTNNTNIFDHQIIKIVVPDEGTVAGLFGDPHIMTFDGLQFDCQAAGEFTTLTSLDNPSFKIQERFTAIQSSDSSTCAQASVSTGVVFADEGKPVIQISTPRSDKSSLDTVNLCPIDFYVDGTAYRLGATLGSSTVTVTLENDNKIKIKHTDTFVSLDVTVHKSNTFGCYIMVQVALPGSFRTGQTLLGLLGTPNGNTDDDWMTPNGVVLEPPSSDLERLFSTAYDYCRENWCAQDSADSLFTYGVGESFDAIYKCDVQFSVEIENAFNAIITDPTSNQELSDSCNGNVACLVDGLCGDMSDAQAALVNEQVIVDTKEEVKATIFLPDQVEVEDVKSVTPETTTTTSTTTTTTTTTTTSTTTTTTTTTSSVSTILDGFFGESENGLELTTEYHIKMTISGTTCKMGDTESDFSVNQITAFQNALAIGFCDFNNFPQGSCSIEAEEISCNDVRRALKHHLHVRKLVDDTENNDLVVQFTVAVTGQCVNYDCSDGVESVKAVGKVIAEYSADQLPSLLTALKTADASLFAFVTVDGIDIYYGDLIAPLLAKYSDWYPKWKSNENTCSNDGQYEPYMKKSKFVKGSLEECCNAYYSWAFDDCMVLGGADKSTASNLDDFYVDYYSNSCKQSCFEKDATDTKNCGGIAPNWMQTFRTADACCSTKLFWLDQASCIAASTKKTINEEDKGSKDWYVDWEMYKCVRDCVKGTGSNCGGLAGNWDDLFITSSSCCNTMLPWLSDSDCVG